MTISKARKKKCKICRNNFTPRTTTQKACSLKCALQIVRQAKEKLQRREQREAKQGLKSLGELKVDAQKPFNKWIRHRDEADPCISCDRYDHEIKHDPRGGKWDAGHFHSVGAREDLRFNEDNVHKQCKWCNDQLKGNQGAYRLSLIEKIGLERVAKLDGPADLSLWNRDELIMIKKDYQKRMRGKSL